MALTQEQISKLRAQWSADFFIYQIVPTQSGQATGSIATGGTAISTIQVQADSAFEWIMATRYGNKNGQAESISNDFLLPVTVQITDSGSGRQLFSAAVPIDSFAGNAKQPFILPQRRIFLPNSSLQFTFVSFGAATFDNISLSLIGRKIFDLRS